jgi:high-affinity nickel permease
MFGLDDFINSYSDGAAAWIVVLVAVLLGLRHATDPDPIAAVTTLVAGTRERATRTVAALGAAWGLGHATTLFAFGVPILVLDWFLPERAQ